MPTLGYHVQGLVRAAGLIKTSEILLRRALKLSGVVSVNVRGHGRMELRPNDSDLFVLSQVFGWEEYKIDPDRLETLQSLAQAWQAEGVTPIIVDAGSNVGYSAVYFAKLFPGACILAIEPDLTSFTMLTRNSDKNANIKPVHAALWSHDRGIQLEQSNNGSWGNHVSEGIGTISRRLDDLIEAVPNARVLIVKLDIEGAEREVIDSCPDIFLNAKCIMVEPHDFISGNSASLYPLFKVAALKKFDTILSGENLLLFSVE